MFMVIITVIIMVIITVIMVIIMVLCLGISLQGRKMSESQTGRQVVRLSSLIPWDLRHAEQLLISSSAPYPVSLEFRVSIHHD